MRRSDVCDYSNVYALVSGTITVTGAEADDHEDREDERNKGFFKNLINILHHLLSA